jgi:hypothetical protein
MIGPAVLDFPYKEQTLWGFRSACRPGDLLTDAYIDVELERFMTLGPCNKKYHGYYDWYGDDAMPLKYPAPSRFTKRDPTASWFSSRFASRTTAAPAPKCPLLRAPSSYEVDQEIMDYLKSHSDKDSASLISEQLVMMEHWNSKLDCSESTEAVAMTALHRSHTNASLNLDHDMDPFREHPEVLRQQQYLQEIIKKQEEEMERIVEEHRKSVSCQQQDSSACGEDGSKSKSEDSKTLESVNSDSLGDDCVELYPGKKVKILNKSHAYAALNSGDASLFQCVGCHKALMASKTTKLLYCSVCGTLTPTDMDCASSASNTTTLQDELITQVHGGA